MKLKSFLGIINKVMPQIIELVEKRYELETNGNIMFGDANSIYEKQIVDSINSELMAISLNTFKYGGELYCDISDTIKGVNNEEDKEQEVYNILSCFKEISYKLYPQSIANTFKEIHCGLQEREIWEVKSANISLFFKEFGHYFIDKDKVKSTYSRFILYINRFAIALDCVLLEAHIDLLQLQNRWNIYVIEKRGIALYGDYIGSIDRIKELLHSISKHKILSQCFPRKLNKPQLNEMRNFLIEEKLIDKNTSKESILYWFDYGDYNENVRPIIWLESKQLARELLEGIYKQTIKPFTLIEKIVPKCMVCKDGNPLKLAKNKSVLNTKSDAIKRFLEAITYI